MFLLRMVAAKNSKAARGLVAGLGDQAPHDNAGMAGDACQRLLVGCHKGLCSPSHSMLISVT